MIPSMQVLCKGSAESCARRGSQVTRLRRVGRLWVDAVEKVGATLTTRNNRIAQAGFLNRSCAFDARLESILLEDSLKIFFRQYRSRREQLEVSKSFPPYPQAEIGVDLEHFRLGPQEDTRLQMA